MSVRSMIAMKQKDGTYKSICCQHDGEPLYTGKMLYEHYRDPMKLNLLLKLGNLSSIKELVSPNLKLNHSFDSPLCDVCVAYHRDRGEKLVSEEFSTLEELEKVACNSNQDYLYLYDNGEWQYANAKIKDYKDIEYGNLEEHLWECDCTFQPSQNYDLYVDEVANHLVNYSKDYDLYEFRDNYNDSEEAFEIIKNDLLKGRVDDYIRILCENIEDNALEKDLSDDTINDYNLDALTLIKELNQYSIEYQKSLDKEELDL